MQHLYGVVAYRPNGDDYFRGCLMAQSDSDFQIHTFNDIASAVLCVASLRFGQVNKPLEDKEWEIHITVDGHMENSDDPSLASVFENIDKEIKEHYANMIEDAAKKELQKKHRKEQAAKNKAARDQEAAEQAERETYEKLKEKYESPDF